MPTHAYRSASRDPVLPYPGFVSRTPPSAQSPYLELAAICSALHLRGVCLLSAPDDSNPRPRHNPKLHPISKAHSIDAIPSCADCTAHQPPYLHRDAPGTEEEKKRVRTIQINSNPGGADLRESALPPLCYTAPRWTPAPSSTSCGIAPGTRGSWSTSSPSRAEPPATPTWSPPFPPSSSRRSSAAGSCPSTGTRRRPSPPSEKAATSSSPRPRPAARASATTFPCSRRSWRARAAARCSSTPPRRWPRTSFERSRPWRPARRASGPPSTTATRPSRSAGHPAAGAGAPHQPGHAPRGHPPEPPGLGQPAPGPPLRRRGRGPRLPGRLRVAHGGRPAAPAAHLRPLRRPPAVHPLLGHHRQPRRACRDPGGASLRGGDRATARHPAGGSSPSGTRRCGTATTGTGGTAPRWRPPASSPTWSSARCGR